MSNWMRLLLGLLLAVSLVGCQDDGEPDTSPTLPAAQEEAGTEAAAAVGAEEAMPAPTPLVAPSATPVPPTPTPTAPLAALVNGQPVFLSAYEKELARYEQGQAELGLAPGADGGAYKMVVLDNLIEQELIRQAALADNIVVTTDMVAQLLAELRQEAGDEAAFQNWLAANQFTEEEFKTALETEMLIEQVKSIVTHEVPFAVPQVHARYIQVDDPALAASLREQILTGADFAALAAQHSLDRQTAPSGGDLGWFPRETLLVPLVEEAAYALNPGEMSDVIAVNNENGAQTYYLLQLLERDEARALTPLQRAQLLQETFEAWLDTLWLAADVERFVEAGD